MANASFSSSGEIYGLIYGFLRAVGDDDVDDGKKKQKKRQALFSPSTGIVDSHALTLSLQGDAEAAGAVVSLRTPIHKAEVTLGVEQHFHADKKTPPYSRVSYIKIQVMLTTTNGQRLHRYHHLHLDKKNPSSLSQPLPGLAR